MKTFIFFAVLLIVLGGTLSFFFLNTHEDIHKRIFHYAGMDSTVYLFPDAKTVPEGEVKELSNLYLAHSINEIVAPLVLLQVLNFLALFSILFVLLVKK
jgi:hypothetical protein